MPRGGRRGAHAVRLQPGELAAPAGEIEALMALLEEYIAREAASCASGASGSGCWAISTGCTAARGARWTDRCGDPRRHRARAQPLHLLRLPRRDRPRGPAAGRRGGAGAARARRRSTRRRWPPALHRRVARSRPADPHLGRDADLEFSALAARLHRALRHAGAVARLHPARISSRRSSTSSAGTAGSGASRPDGLATWRSGSGSPRSPSRSRSASSGTAAGRSPRWSLLAAVLGTRELFGLAERRVRPFAVARAR